MGRRPLKLSKGSNTLLTSLMDFPWPWGTTEDVTTEDFHPGGTNVARVFSIVSWASSGPTNLKKHIQRVII